MNYLFLFASLFLTGVLHGQSNHTLLIRVAEEGANGKKIKFAKVSVIPLTAKGLNTLETISDSNGLARIYPLPEGLVKLHIKRDGFEDFYSYDCKVTGYDDDYTVRMRRVPNHSYYLRGQVIDANSQSLEGVSVQFKAPFIDPVVTQTDSFGSFKFITNDENITPDMEFSLTFKKFGYSDYRLKENFLRRDMPTIDVTMHELGEKKKRTQTGWSFGIIGELNSFISNVPENQLKFSSLYATIIMHRSNWLKHRIHAGLAINFNSDARLKTVNFFETLNGNQSEIETGYKVKTRAELLTKFYLKPQAVRLTKYTSPYIGISTLLIETDSAVHNYTLGQLSATNTIKSSQKLLPRLSFGYTFQWNIFVIEPAFSYTFFDLRSLNFKFNYFGNSEPFEEINKFHRIDLSITLRLLLLTRHES